MCLRHSVTMLQGVKEAAHTSLIIYTEPVAVFMIENDILAVTLWGFLQLLSTNENMMNEDCNSKEYGIGKQCSFEYLNNSTVDVLVFPQNFFDLPVLSF